MEQDASELHVLILVRGRPASQSVSRPHVDISGSRLTSAPTPLDARRVGFLATKGSVSSELRSEIGPYIYG